MGSRLCNGTLFYVGEGRWRFLQDLKIRAVASSIPGFGYITRLDNVVHTGREEEPLSELLAFHHVPTLQTRIKTARKKALLEGFVFRELRRHRRVGGGHTTPSSLLGGEDDTGHERNGGGSFPASFGREAAYRRQYASLLGVVVYVC